MIFQILQLYVLMGLATFFTLWLINWKTYTSTLNTAMERNDIAGGTRILTVLVYIIIMGFIGLLYAVGWPWYVASAIRAKSTN